MCGSLQPRYGAGSIVTAGARLRIPLAIGLLLAAVAGCGTRDGAGNRIELWAMGKEGEAVQALLPEFHRRHPDIQVSVQQIPWNAAHEKLLTAHVGGALPDVFQLGNTWIAEFVAVGALDNLTGRWSEAVPPDDFFPGVLEANRLNGALYGVPWYVDTRVLFYRSDLLRRAGFPEAPRSWPDWRAAMERLQAMLGPEDHAILLPANEWQMPVILALQFGSPLLRDGERYGDFRGSAFRGAFARYLDIFRRGWAPSLDDTRLGNLYQDFGRGRFTFYVTGPWNLAEFGRKLPPDVQGHWTTAPLPAPDGHYPGVSIAGGASLVLAKASRRKDAAWKLIEFLAEPARQLAFYRLTGDLPARKTPWQDPALAANTEARAFRIQLDRVLPLPRIPEWERVAAKIGRYAEKAIRGELDSDAALSNLDRDVDAILEKRRWLLAREKR